jgi:hypothetical protein
MKSMDFKVKNSMKNAVFWPFLFAQGKDVMKG